MQLQIQVPRRDWSSAAATSILQPQTASINGGKTEPNKQKPKQADRSSEHLLQIKL